ncbi:hypothetical protein ABZP36_006408 [Zizania latifolia]
MSSLSSPLPQQPPPRPFRRLLFHPHAAAPCCQGAPLRRARQIDVLCIHRASLSARDACLRFPVGRHIDPDQPLPTNDELVWVNVLLVFCISLTKRQPNQAKRICYVQVSQIRQVHCKKVEIMVVGANADPKDTGDLLVYFQKAGIWAHLKPIADRVATELEDIVPCTSYMLEQKLVEAWCADKAAEALRCQNWLVEEEEAAQKGQAELTEGKGMKKLRQKEQRLQDSKYEDVMVRAVGEMGIRSDLMDAHLFVFKWTTLQDILEEKEAYSSIRFEVLPYLVRSQLRSSPSSVMGTTVDEIGNAAVPFSSLLQYPSQHHILAPSVF